MIINVFSNFKFENNLIDEGSFEKVLIDNATFGNIFKEVIFRKQKNRILEIIWRKIYTINEVSDEEHGIQDNS
jgi:hypothetical protein